MNPSWEANVRKVTPYTPGEQPGEKVIKLNTNECPYPPAPLVGEAQRALETADLRLYPAPDAGALVDALAAYHGVSPERLFVGVGSDDVISQIFLTFFAGEKPLLFPDVTYSFYPVWARLYRIPYRCVALDADYRIRREDYLGVENGGVIFPNPNAPTGLLEPLSLVEDIVRGNPGSVVVVDEAYVDYAGEGASALPLTEKYDNLIVVRTFSKSRALAGLRIGYAIGDARLIRYLNDVKYSVNSYTMNRPSIAMGVASIRDEEYFRDIISRVVATRERMRTDLEGLGFSCMESRSNFLFVTHPAHRAAEIYAYLKSCGIYVRYFDLPRIDDYLRITVGTNEEAGILREALEKYLDVPACQQTSGARYR